MTKKITRTLAGLAVASLMPFAGSAVAQEPLTAEDYLAYLEALSSVTNQPIGNATTVGVPSGFGLPPDLAFFSVAVSDTRERGRGNSPDGSMAFGFGLGDPDNAVSVDTILNITSVHPDDYGDSGTINFKFARNLGPNSAASLSFGNIIKWGDAADNEIVTTAAYSRRFTLANRSAMISAGVSDNIGTQDNEPGAFLGFSMAIADNLSGGISWVGDEWVAGLNTSVKFLGDDVYIGLSYSDLTSSNGRLNLTLTVVDPEFVNLLRRE